MTPEQIKKLGEDMIEEGKMSEFYQKGKGKNLEMYGFHHHRYMTLKRRYEEATKK